MHPSVENRFYDLLGRKLAGECTPPELEELGSMLQLHPELQIFYDQILTHSPEVADIDIEAAWVTHHSKIKPARIKRLMAWTLAAATVIIAIGLTWLFLNKDNNKQTIVETGTQKESRYTMTLPDGSIIRLNAKSKVKYAEEFAKRREVYLEGEAYFEVAHNEAVPFIVHTGDADIKVLGTKFNVRNYSNEHRMEAALLTGSIELTLRADAQHKILLKPSDKIIVKKQADDEPAKTPSTEDKKIELTSIKVQDSVIVETSWLNDKMGFYDKPFSEIALDLERRFGVHIEFKNNTVSGYKYTGVYDEDNAADILNILQMIKPFQYTLDNNQITIY
jgi:transmembrane sensor